MAGRKCNQHAQEILARLAEEIGSGKYEDAKKLAAYACVIIEGLRPFVMWQGERSPIAAIELEDLVFASVIARRADLDALKNPSKETIDMAAKTSERRRKAAVNMQCKPKSNKTAVRSLGLASQMRPLLKQAEGAVEEALVDVPFQPLDPPSFD